MPNEGNNEEDPESLANGQRLRVFWHVVAGVSGNDVPAGTTRGSCALGPDCGTGDSLLRTVTVTG